MNFLACNAAQDGASSSSTLIKAGDCVIVYEGVNSMKAVYVNQKGRFENRFGVFKHQSWIGKPFGSKVTASTGGKGWVYLLAPTPELWTQVLRHRTQILYLADISMVVMQLDLRPGSVVLESGTGSGSLTHSLVRAVAPTGHVHTFEFHPGRAEEAAAEFKQHGLSKQVTVTQRNIEELGFPETLHGAADAVFLDLPGPHKVVPSAAACLRPNGRFCSFSPCIEQVQRTAEALSAAGFTDVITYECLLREYEVHRESLTTSIRLAECPAPKRPRAERPAAAAAAEVPKAQADADGEAAARAEPEAQELGQAAAAAEPGAQGAAQAPAAEGAADAGADAGSGADKGTIVDAEGGAKAGEGGSERAQAAAESGPGQEAGQQRGREGAGGRRSWAAGPAAAPLRIVSCRPSLEARGHTGYLIFARKFVCG